MVVGGGGGVFIALLAPPTSLPVTDPSSSGIPVRIVWIVACASASGVFLTAVCSLLCNTSAC